MSENEQNENEVVEYRPMIRDLPDDERPRERLQYYGAGALSNAELLAIILRVGVKNESVINMSQRLLAQFGGLAGLAKAGFEELCNLKGLGVAKTAQLKAALELGKRVAAVSPQDKPQIASPSDAANLVMSDMMLLEQEHLNVLLLDTKNRVVKNHNLYIGSLNTSVVRVGELFREAIRANSAGVIIVHNHPSGDPTPSAEDVKVTRQIVSAGKVLDIPVLDHLVIGRGRFISLKERGLGFEALIEND